MTVKIGYLLPTREHILLGRHNTNELLDAARLVQQLGFDSAWAGDSLLARPRHDPLTLLAGVAAATPELYVGTAVLLPALRNPVILAQQLATLDQLSNGKLIVGVGIAADAPTIHAEFAAAGVPFDKRVGRLMEGIRLWRALWNGEPVDWQGRWSLTQAELAPVPKQAGGPPIWLGTGADAGIVRAATHLDGWFPIGPDVDTFAQRRQDYHQAVTRAGRSNQTTGLYLTLCIDQDPDRADDAINQYLRSYYNVEPTLMRRIQACFGGPLEEVLAFVRGYVQAGAEHLVIRLVGDHQAALKQLAQHRDELH